MAVDAPVPSGPKVPDVRAAQAVPVAFARSITQLTVDPAGIAPPVLVTVKLI